MSIVSKYRRIASVSGITGGRSTWFNWKWSKRWLRWWYSWPSVPSLLRGSRLNGTMRLLSYSWSRRFIWFSRNKVVAFDFYNQRKTLMPIVRYLQCLFKHVYNAHCKHLIMGIVKTLYDLLAQMCKYSFGLIRMEPCYFWVPFKPSHLLPGVDPGVSFDFLHGEV